MRTTLAEGRPRQGFIEDTAFAKLLTWSPPRLQPLLLFLYRTGCRLGEAKQIQWSQVDLRAGTVRLTGDQTKSGEPRTLPLPDALIEMLRGGRSPRKGRYFLSASFARRGSHPALRPA